MIEAAQIRPQYHFRRIGGHLHAWDVRELIARAEPLAVVEFPLSEIREIDEAYWTAEGPDLTCRQILEHAELIVAADLSYPIILCPEGRIMDGMHRVLRAVSLNHPTISARRLDVMPPPDFVDVAPDDLPY